MPPRYALGTITPHPRSRRSRRRRRRRRRHD